MDFNGKEVWEYKNDNNTHHVKIFERNNNILVIESKGTAYFEGCEKAFDFILEYAKQTKKQVSILLQNINLHLIDYSVKKLFLRFQEANYYIVRIATVGNNPFINHFGKIYQHTCRFNFTIRSFKNKNIAIIWLNNGESM